MDIKFYMIKGTLERAVRQDFFDNEGYFLEDKIFFQKDYITKKFTTLFRTPTDYPFGMKDAEYFKVKKYHSDLIDDLLRHALLYKLSTNNHELDFHFNLYIKTATYTDIFHRDLLLKMHTTYYNMETNGTVTGPFFINEFDKPEQIQNRLEKGMIYILSKKQLFEPITLSKAS